jgi:hypothetical protein
MLHLSVLLQCHCQAAAAEFAVVAAAAAVAALVLARGRLWRQDLLLMWFCVGASMQKASIRFSRLALTSAAVALQAADLVQSLTAAVLLLWHRLTDYLTYICPLMV